MSPFPVLRSRMPRAALLLAACLTLLVAAPAAHALPTLHPGDHGRSVKRLQRALGVTADGIYGKGTARRVQEPQAGGSERGLAASAGTGEHQTRTGSGLEL